MSAELNRLIKEERGITALETAIILIAFVVVAAIFAFTVLTTGTFLTEQSKQAAYAGLQEVSSSMQLEGSVVLEETGEYIVFNLATVAGGSSVDLSKVNITYRDSSTNQDVSIVDKTCADVTYPGADYAWTVMLPNATILTNCILKSGMLAKVVVNLGAQNSVSANQTFGLQVTPPTGGILLIQRVAPAQITEMTDLH